MKWSTFVAVGIFGAATSAFHAGPAAGENPILEPPVAISASEGKWVVGNGQPVRRASRDKASLTYQVLTFPRLTLHHIKLECEFPGSHSITVTGLVPAQRFPQPQIALSVGDRSWTAIPNARYHQRSQPVRHTLPANLPLDDNLRGANLSWPGHPPYASLTFHQQADASLLQALRSGQPIRVAFDGQNRVYPAIPLDVATKYADQCASMDPKSASFSRRWNLPR